MQKREDGPRVGVRPRLWSPKPVAGSEGLYVLTSAMAVSWPPKRRRFPRGMLLEPVNPWLRHAMVRWNRADGG